MLEPSAATITAIVTNDAEMSPVPRPVSPWPACYQIVQGGVNKNPAHAAAGKYAGPGQILNIGIVCLQLITSSQCSHAQTDIN